MMKLKKCIVKYEYTKEEYDTGLSITVEFNSKQEALNFLRHSKSIIVFNEGIMVFEENRTINSASLEPLDYDELVYYSIDDFIEALDI